MQSMSHKIYLGDYQKHKQKIKMETNYNSTETETYFTKDFWLAGALLASGKKLIRLDWRDGRAFFMFPDLDKCEQAAQAYWAGDLKVSAKAFTDALRTLKDRLYGNGKANKY